MRPQFAHLDTEGVADLSRRRRAYSAPHRPRTLPLPRKAGRRLLRAPARRGRGSPLPAHAHSHEGGIAPCSRLLL
jgi:hypothetical protein